MWYNVFMQALLKSPLHGLLSRNLILIRYTGRKSGKTITLPVNYVRIGDRLLVTSLRTRSWWRNLRRAAPFHLRLQGNEVPARAEVLEEQAEVAAALGELFAAAPQMSRYFDVRLDENQKPLQGDLEQAARERVVVRIQPGV